mmetsp:Transcript_33582/g.88182  ORF Transcript_33582/g.88182 Transcript_33582/m.88182 type:complete len:1943 (+) Transcript_33582:766-6594(+)
MQSSWGATLASIAEVKASGVEGWIAAQMAMRPTLLRENFRVSANPSYPEIFNGSFVTGMEVGGVRPICSAGSRWAQYAVTEEDSGRQIVLAPAGVGLTSLTIDGVVRSVANATYFASVNSTGSYLVCSVQHVIGGAITINSGISCVRSTNVVISNPPVQSAPSNRMVMQTADATWLADLTPAVRDAKLLTAAAASAPGFQCTSPSRVGPFFATVAGVQYMADPRVELLTNSLESPTTTANPHPAVQASCPTVPKTFLNEETCVTGVDSCAALEFEPVSVQLNEDFLRQYYALAGKAVYYITGLRLDSSSDPPCDGGWQRFVPVAGSSCTNNANVNSTLLEITTDVVSAALYSPRNSRGNAFVQEIRANNRSCDVAAAIGIKVLVNGTCWQHVHENEYNVYDFTSWSNAHPGGPERILQFALRNSTNLEYSSSHPMTRWYANRRSSYGIVYVGRLYDNVSSDDLPSALMVSSIAEAIGAAPASSVAHEVCGSPGEVANNPAMGHRQRFAVDNGVRDGHKSQELDRTIGTISSTQSRPIVWSNVALRALDQLRQRAAWALSQILVVNTDSVSRTTEAEFYLAYYDIFVRNAFGNYRDILKEVTYSPVMGRMLSFTNNKARGASGNFPDENYAREVLQLFSIGLYKLNSDGTQQHDSQGNPIPSYTIEDIQASARAWTGLMLQPHRGNVESNVRSSNYVDPHRMVAGFRDQYPKKLPGGSFLGDGVPVCSKMPRDAFLRRGAKYRYLGTRPVPQKQTTYGTSSRNYRAVILDVANSTLANALCHSGGSSPGSRCRFKSVFRLPTDMPCTGQECTIDAPRIVNITDPNSPGGGTAHFYEYVRSPCVELAFFNSPVLITARYGTTRSSSPRAMCANPATQAAAPACCSNSSSTSTTATCATEFSVEAVSYGTAQARCSAPGNRVCNFTRVNGVADGTCFTSVYFWQPASRPCILQAQVDNVGTVNLVDFIPEYPYAPHLAADSVNTFTVGWDNNSYPRAADSCSGECEVRGTTCVCNISVVDSAVFSSDGTVPSRAAVLAALTVGASDPDRFETGTYTRCSVAACTLAERSVVVYNPGSSNGLILSKDTIIGVAPAAGSTRWQFFQNVRSTVYTPGRSFSFRNPPVFHSRYEESIRDAEHETDAYFDFLMDHPNTAPFVSRLLIQRLTSSNPSPRYVEAVSNAFTSGRYGSFGNGTRGDLGATFAAILLDREARSAVLDHDPQLGKLREPLEKIMHMIRGLEMLAPGNLGHDQKILIADRVGQYPFEAESVFNFFQYDFAPEGAVSQASLVAPEAISLTAPDVIALVNGLSSSVRFGLSSCDGGLSSTPPGAGCGTIQQWNTVNRWARTLGNVSLSFGSNASAADVVRTLNTVLTGGRLSSRSQAVLTSAYERIRRSVDHDEGLRIASRLTLMSSEFHTLSPNRPTLEVDPDALDTIQDNWNCWEDCDMIGGLNRNCSFCGAQRKCCRQGSGSRNPSGPHICAREEGCQGKHCCVPMSANTTTDTSISPTAVPTAAPTSPSRRPYKAVVYLWLAGGCDSYNMLVPHSGCGGGGYAQYAQVRSNIALSRNALHEIPATVRSAASAQDCSTYGLHPQFTNLARQYSNNDALFFANSGTLIVPMNSSEFRAKSKPVPPQVFAHNAQTKVTQNGDAASVSTSDGLLGRAADALRAAGISVGSYSVAGSSTILQPADTETYDIVTSSGVPSLSHYTKSLVPDILEMANYQSESIMGETWNSALVTSMVRTARLSSSLSGRSVNTTFPTCGSGNRLSCDLRQVARIIGANQEHMQNEVDFFHVKIGGFDVHGDAVGALADVFERVDGALGDFEAELRAMGMWNNVTIVEQSEFARTLTSNGVGSDHGWGGHFFMSGGCVRGGQILGTYPDDLSANSPWDVGRGRVVPTTSLEQIWHGVLEYVGVPAESMHEVLPNLANFHPPFNASDLFNCTT